MCLNPENLRMMALTQNNFLLRRTDCYFVLDYLRYGQPGNPEFILTLKNTFNEKSISALNTAKNKVKEILCKWIPRVMAHAGLPSCIMICVPRAKALNSYKKTQLYLRDGVSEAVQSIPGVEDGTDMIIRTIDTKTTHLSPSVARVKADGATEANTGSDPYPGITKRTCLIDENSILGQNIILVDDIYTAGINIDEDCIQALYDAGAAKVILFALACTV